jgi:hypothetical protein
MVSAAVPNNTSPLPFIFSLDCPSFLLNLHNFKVSGNVQKGYLNSAIINKRLGYEFVKKAFT